MPRGGKRKGAGPKHKWPQWWKWKMVRVPDHLKKQFYKWLHTQMEDTK